MGILASKSYDFPIICVGNLNTGGTGKTPMIEYLINLLKNLYKIATLSRGYKRQTKGFVLADATTPVHSIGDEPYQFYYKFKKDIVVGVDENRRRGIALLRSKHPETQIVLLDDAYQHRRVKAGCNILLTAYNNLYVKDYMLPAGNLREPRSEIKRAHVIVVTKCPKDISESEKTKIKQKLGALQPVFFSSIQYAERVLSVKETKTVSNLPFFCLVTGIANAKPLVNFLRHNNLRFQHLEYADHYNFKKADITLLEKKDLIITTEKDYMRLKRHKTLLQKLYYLPIEVKLHEKEAFNTLILDFLNQFETL